MRRSLLAVSLLVLTPVLRPGPALAQGTAVERGVQSLRGMARGLPPGEAALAGLALVKAEVPPDDPALVAILRTLDGRFRGTTYSPQRIGPGGHSIYEAAVTALFYANLDPDEFRERLEVLAAYILRNQMANGGWDYGHRMSGPLGDTSISQYAVLGLWELENGGVRVPAAAWDRAAQWYLSKQSREGSWNYHRDEREPETISMTAAGVGSLLICKRQLERHRAMARQAPSPLLRPLAPDPSAPQGYRAKVTTAALDAGINAGIDWLKAHWTVAADPVMGQSVYYGLYGIERIGALIEEETIAGIDWFSEGRQSIEASQQGDGTWRDDHGLAPNTSWAILFLTRSTEQSVQRFEVARLGAGTLVGGRGLPDDLNSLTIAGGHVLVRPMNGAIEEMLAVLEDPRALGATEALAGLIARYHTEGPSALRPHRARFRALLKDPDPGIRAAAAWALGRTGELDLAPDLIAALEDSDDRVVRQALDGLRLLSRKLDGPGPPPGATAEQKRATVLKWRSWYEEIRPPELARPVHDPGP